MKSRRVVSSISSFTLIELLVVVGIIAILAGLILAGASSAIRSAHLASSMSNLRSMGVAINDYAGDNNNMVPTWYDYNADQYWWQTLFPYLGGTGNNYNLPVFHDPGDTHYDGSSTAQIADTISYGYNYLLLGRGNDANDYSPPRSLVSLKGSTLAIADGPAANCYGYIDNVNNTPDTNRYVGVTPGLFVDGHVEKITISTNFESDEPYFIQN